MTKPNTKRHFLAMPRHQILQQNHPNSAPANQQPTLPNWYVSPDDLMYLRATALLSLPCFVDGNLDGFVRTVFQDETVLRSYFNIKSRPGYRPEPGVFGLVKAPLLIPFDLATSAARHAKGMNIVLPELRELTYACSLINPLGMFYHSRLDAMDERKTIVDFAEFSQTRNRLLKLPLSQLRGRDARMASIIGHVMGVSTDHDAPVKEVSSVGAAVFCSSLSLNALWLMS